MKRVFISGVTGTMGSAGLKHLMEYKDQLDIVTLVRPREKNKRIMEKYKDDIDIVWGDLTNYADVKRAIIGVDYILHVAAFVSPEADYHPNKAWEVNVGSTENILRAIDELELYHVKLVYIGSVAETGDRMPPIHWGRIGDPLKPSVFDTYAVTKIAAERKIIESGLKYWVSLRQTGILHYGLLEVMDGIMFHQPLENVLEWISEEDSGRLLANVCTKDLPDKFWKNVYNIGGGETCRVNNYDFTAMILATIGVNDIEKIFEPNWFATRNFHGQYYLDSDILNDYLDFRREGIEDFMIRLKKDVGFPTSTMKYLPNFIIKNFIMKTVCKSDSGTLGWIRSDDRMKIDAFFGSIEDWKEISKWDELSLRKDYGKILKLEHGYDENKDESLLNIDDMKGAAEFRGGTCISACMVEGDMDSQLKWECSFFHKFEASPRLILKTGHWCEECEAPPWNHAEIAKVNSFFAQVWDIKKHC